MTFILPVLFEIPKTGGAGMSSKWILTLSMMGTMTLLVFGIADPNNPIMWLASTSLAFTWIRAIMIVILFGLLITEPPRNVYFRMVTGVIAVSLGAWALGTTYDNNMQLLDTLSLLQFSICTGLIALETDYEKVISPAKKSAAKKHPAARKAKLATA